MFIAMDENGLQITAEVAKKGRKYFCSVCSAPVTFKSGNIKLPHFSHHRILDCIRYLYKKESIGHLQAKHDLYLEIGRWAPVAMEYYLQTIEQIPDLLIDQKLALEIQLSKISPELILERSNGYRSLGLDVIWLLEAGSLKVEGGTLFPTHFQLSTAYRNSIFTYDIEEKQLTRWMLHHHHGCGRWRFSKREIETRALMNKDREAIEPVSRLTTADISRIIQREKQQKSVMNPTLSFIYQLRLDPDRLPVHLQWTLEAERWILNPPLEWKLFIYHGLETGSFDYRQFERFIHMRVIQEAPSKEVVVRDLIEGYYMLYNSQ